MASQISQTLINPVSARYDGVDCRRHGRMYCHYLFAIASLSVYGGQVCPYVESLAFLDNLLAICLVFAALALLRPSIYQRFVDGANCQQRMFAAIRVDFGLYVFGGFVLTTFYGLNYAFPLISALKVIFGFALLGLFAALDSAALEERRLINRAEPVCSDVPFVPLGKKILLFICVAGIGLAAVMLLLVVKDMDWLLSANREVDDARASAYIAIEFLVVLTLMLGSTTNVVLSYSHNLSLRLARQSAVLAEVSKGCLQTRIRDVGNDEMTQVSAYINETLAALEVGHRELSATRDLTIRAMSSLAETRDNETGLHIVRTQYYVKLLAEHLSANPQFSDRLTPAFVDLLYKSAPLHDVGKIGIPDHILLKPGKLTDEEFVVMRTHARLGRDALASAATGNEASAFLCLAQEIALNHHEKWDGSGYPSGLIGEDIPLSARLMALADVYDALISKRVYKDAMTHDQARAIILEGKGSHFDPRVVDAFLATESRFVAIAQEYGD